MKKLLLIPDSFKGTMSSMEICEIMSHVLRHYFPAAEILSIPVADGGEGTVDAFLTAMGGEKITVPVTGPLGAAVDGFYGRIGDTAIIEMAAAAGLPLVSGPLQPEAATTYGVGQLMCHAANHGAKRLIIGLGGSATTDGGCGAAAAAGVRFYNTQGQKFVPVGGTLKDIASIDISGLDLSLAHTEIVTMCDISNPLSGPQGAAYVFAPQKGADAAAVERLDQGLQHLAQVVRTQLGIEMETLSGAGAAGGMGGGMAAFFGSHLEMGIQTVLDTVNFDKLLSDADLVFTGEGKIDSQSLRGKVVIGVAQRAKQQNVPVIAVVGDIGDPIDAAYDQGVSAIFSINRVAVPYQAAKFRAKEDLQRTMDNLCRLLTNPRLTSI
jgi:glycerate kinase